MQLQSYSPINTSESLQTTFESLYDLTDFEDQYFRYMDYENIVEFSPAEYEEFMDMLARGNAIFVKAYEFYRKDLVRNLPDFAFMEDLFTETFPLDQYFLGRYDVIREAGTGTYKFLETNANTPGMITETCHVSKFLHPGTSANCEINAQNSASSFTVASARPHSAAHFSREFHQFSEVPENQGQFSKNGYYNP